MLNAQYLYRFVLYPVNHQVVRMRHEFTRAALAAEPKGFWVYP